MGSLAVLGVVLWRNLSLRSCFDHIQWTSHDTGQAACGDCGQDFETETDIILSAPSLCKPALLFIKGKLQCREREVSDDRGFVSRIKCTKPFDSCYRFRRIPGGLVVVTGIEERIIVSALQLQPRLEDFGGYVDNRGGKVGNETWFRSVTESLGRQTETLPLARYASDGFTPRSSMCLLQYS